MRFCTRLIVAMLLFSGGSSLQATFYYANDTPTYLTAVASAGANDYIVITSSFALTSSPGNVNGLVSILPSPSSASYTITASSGVVALSVSPTNGQTTVLVDENLNFIDPYRCLVSNNGILLIHADQNINNQTQLILFDGTLSLAYPNANITIPIFTLGEGGSGIMTSTSGNVVDSVIDSAGGPFTFSGGGSITLSGASPNLSGFIFLTDATTLNLTGSVSSSAQLSMLGGSTFTLGSASQTFANFGGDSGTLNIGSHIFNLAPTSALTSSFGGAFVGSGSFKLNASDLNFTLSGASPTFTGTIQVGNTGLTGSTLTLTGSLGSAASVNLFTGNTFSLAGPASTAQTLGTISGTGTVNIASGNTLTVGGSSFGGRLSGSGTFVNSGAYTLSGVSSAFNGTLRPAANLTFGSAASIGAQTTVALTTGVTFNMSNPGIGALTFGAVTGSGGNFNFGSNSITINSLSDSEFDGIFTGAGTITQTGVAKFTIGGNLNASFTGDVIVNGTEINTLALTGVLPSATSIDIVRGTFSLEGSGQNQTLILNGGGTLNIGASNTLTAAGTAFGGILTGTGTFVNGASPYTLSGASPLFAGTVQVGTGTLTLAGAGATFGSLTLIELSTGKTFDMSDGGVGAQSLAGITGSGGNFNFGTNPLTIVSTSNTVFGGTLTGSATFTKSGSASFTLSGNNSSSFTGAIQVSQGTLALTGSLASTTEVSVTGGTFDLSAISSSQTIGSLSGSGGAVNLGAKTLVVNGAGSYGGALVGSGLFQKSTSGIFTLTGDCSAYSGQITVDSANTLRIQGSLGSTTRVNLSALAVFDISRVTSDSQTLGAVNGSGGTLVFKSIPLTLNPAADCSFSGYLYGSANLTLASSHKFTLGGDNSTSFSGNINMTSTGGFTLTGALNSVTSLFIANSGAIFDMTGIASSQRLSGLSGAGQVHLGTKNLTVGNSLDEIFNGVISGVGGTFTKSGSGNLILNGVNTYTGATTVNQGRLSINGILSNSSVTVNSGAILGGTGQIVHSVTVNGGGTISPGNSIGTLQVGSLNLASLANTAIEISPTQASLIVVNGSATLNGNLNITVDSGHYADGTIFTLINSSGGISNTFDALNISTLNVTPIYNANTMQIRVNGSTFIPYFSTAALSGNELFVGTYLNDLGDYPFMRESLVSLGRLTTAQLKSALNTICPARLSAVTFAEANTLFAFATAMHSKIASKDRLKNRVVAAKESKNFDLLACGADSFPVKKEQESCIESDFALWSEWLSLFANQNSQDQMPKFSFNTNAVLIGLDYYGLSLIDLTAGFGYASTDLGFDGGYGGAASNLYTLTLYGLSHFGNATLELGLWGGFTEYKNSRNIFYPNFQATASSNHDGFEVAPHFGFSYDFTHGHSTFAPYINVDWVFLSQERFTESGPSVYNMNFQSRDASMLRSEVGFLLNQHFQSALGELFFKEAASYLYKKAFKIGYLQNVAIVGAPDALDVYAFTKSQSLFSPTFEVILQGRRGPFIALSYEGEFGSGYTSNQILVKFGIDI